MSEFDSIPIGLTEIPLGQIHRWEIAIDLARLLLARFADSAWCQAADANAARRTRIQLQGLADVLEQARTEHEREVEAITREGR